MAYKIKTYIGCDSWILNGSQCDGHFDDVWSNMPGFIGTYEPEIFLTTVRSPLWAAAKQGWTTVWSAEKQCILWLCPECSMKKANEEG